MFSPFSDGFRADFIERVSSFDCSLLDDRSLFIPELVDDFFRHCGPSVMSDVLDSTKEKPLLLALRITQIFMDNFNYYFSSFFRDPQKNSLVGGAKFSQHLVGNAVDVVCSSSSDYYKVLCQVLRDFPDVSVGVSKSHLHFDFRKGSPIIFVE